MRGEPARGLAALFGRAIIVDIDAARLGAELCFIAAPKKNSARGQWENRDIATVWPAAHIARARGIWKLVLSPWRELLLLRQSTFRPPRAGSKTMHGMYYMQLQSSLQHSSTLTGAIPLLQSTSKVNLQHNLHPIMLLDLPTL